MLLQKPPLDLNDRLMRSCHLKRFFECWMADASFRSQLESDPDTATATRNLNVQPETFRLIWEWLNATSGGLAPDRTEPLRQIPVALSEFQSLKTAEHGYQNLLRERSIPDVLCWRTWRARQVARMSSQFSSGFLQAVLHPPFAIELSQGCSVGCWFCGVGALKHGDQFEYTNHNAALFLAVLHTIRKYTGDRSGGQGFLYWATDPLDNPDYEKFASDFRDTFGRYPDLTTSQPLRHLSRVRRLIEHSTASGDFYVRFSVLTLRQLYAIHSEFTAEQLATVSLIPRNKGSLAPISPTGNARSSQMLQAREPSIAVDESIACVSGFLVNMVERSVKLVSPCPASDRWPLGYIVYDSVIFSDGADFEHAIVGMMDRHMRPQIHSDWRLRFRSDLKYSPEPDGFRLFSANTTLSFRQNPLFEVLGELINEGNCSSKAINLLFKEEFDINFDISDMWVSFLFENGILDEEPLSSLAESNR